MNNDVKIFGGIIAATVLLIVGAVFFLGPGESGTGPGPQVSPTIVPRKELLGDDTWTVGSSSAKVTIVEFGDYECPTCKTYEPLINQVKKHYGDKVQFAYRHFPIVDKHKKALSSAAAAEAAGNQGKFWEYHKKLYEISPDLSEKNLSKIATELKLDMEKFTKDANSDAARQKVLDDLSAGTQVGVSGTPTFFINGKLYPLSKLQNLAAFQNIIDPLLKN